MKYISLMGTQTMAVLNPLLALMEQGKTVEKVYILATRKTAGRAETLKNFLVPDKIAPEHFDIIPVSDSLQKDREGREAAHHVISGLMSDGMVFNLAGGMNFQIAACVQVLSKEKCRFLYPESAGIHHFFMENCCMTSHEILPLPASVDVLKLQDISYSIEKSNIHPFLETVQKKYRFSVPSGALRHVRVYNEILNKDVIFDLVWNSGNEMKFLKVIHSSPKYNKNPDFYLQEARSVITLATNRELFGELYHRNVLVLTNHRASHERIVKEGGGKITSLFYFESSGNLGEKLLLAELKQKLERFMNPPLTAPFSKEVIRQETGNSKSGDTVLYTSLGSNIMPSLIALWSHSPAEICFVYTPGIPEIESYRDAMLSEKKNLPVNRVSFYPVSIEGKEIQDMPVPPKTRPLVNITPGTKGHTAFLTLWAQKHGLPVCSMNNFAGKYEEIPQGSSGDMKAPPPVPFLKLTGINVKQFGDGKGSILQNREQHESILDFIRMTDRENKAVSDFYRKPIVLENAGSEYLEKNKKVRIWQQGKKDLIFSTEGDEWFEALTGFVMAECGAQDVQVRVKTRWSEKTEAYLSQIHGNDIHMTDIDVIARFHTQYYVISCKSGNPGERGKISAEANAFATLFGRFAVPLVCYLKYKGEPYNTNNGVYIFGYKTLCDTEAMKVLLKQAVVVRRNTGRGE